MDGVGHEVVPQGVSLHQRRHCRHVSQESCKRCPVVSDRTDAGRGRMRGVDAPSELLAENGRQARAMDPPPVQPTMRVSVSPACWSCRNLLADDRLVQDVVEHGAQGVADGRVRRPPRPPPEIPRCPATPTSWQVWAIADPTSVGQTATGEPRRQAFDHQPPVRLGVVRGADLPHLRTQAVERRRRRAPSPLPAVSVVSFATLDGVVVRLWHGGVRL